MQIKLIVILLIIPLFLWAQTTNHESCKEVHELLMLSNEAQLNVDMVSMIKYAKEALSQAKLTNCSLGIAQSSMFIGTALYGLGNYKESLEFLSMAENEEFTKTNLVLSAEIHRVRGRVYDAMGLRQESMNSFRKGIEDAKKIKDPVYKNQVLSSGIQNLIDTYRMEKKYDSVYANLEKNRAILMGSDQNDVYPNTINFYVEYGRYYSMLNKYDSAMYYFSKSRELLEKYKYPYTSYHYKALGEMYMHQNQVDTALSYYLKGLNNAEENGLQTEEIELSKLISEIYIKKGEPAISKDYQLQALNLENQIHLETKKASEYVINVVLKEEIERMSKNNNRRIAIIIGIAFLLILFGILFYLMKQKRDRNLIIEKQKIIFQKENILAQKELETQGLHQRLNTSFNEVIQLAKENSPEFLTRFREVYPQFINKLLEINPKLQSSELKFCAYIYINFSTKDIAEYTYTSTRTVQTRKYKLRKKLNISAEEDMYIWIKNIV